MNDRLFFIRLTWSKISQARDFVSSKHHGSLEKKLIINLLWMNVQDTWLSFLGFFVFLFFLFFRFFFLYTRYTGVIVKARRRARFATLAALAITDRLNKNMHHYSINSRLKEWWIVEKRFPTQPFYFTTYQLDLLLYCLSL